MSFEDFNRNLIKDRRADGGTAKKTTRQIPVIVLERVKPA